MIIIKRNVELKKYRYIQSSNFEYFIYMWVLKYGKELYYYTDDNLKIFYSKDKIDLPGNDPLFVIVNCFNVEHAEIWVNTENGFVKTKLMQNIRNSFEEMLIEYTYICG